jgi:8-oxo-dGTP pyrophosphatase MutT (NUDIX family)
VTGAKRDEPGRWRTFGERTVYNDQWVWLGQVDVEVPGGERYWRPVIRLHRVALVVLLDDHDQVLMLWRHRFVPDLWGWELPGGLVDADEEPSDAAARELEEETGYRAGHVEHLVTFRPMPGMVDAEHFVFVGRNPERVGDSTGLSGATRAEWVPLASVPGLIDAGDIWDAGSLLALSRMLMKGRE